MEYTSEAIELNARIKVVNTKGMKVAGVKNGMTGYYVMTGYGFMIEGRGLLQWKGDKTPWTFRTKKLATEAMKDGLLDYKDVIFVQPM